MISRNSIINTKTSTGEDNTLVPIGEFYLGEKVVCGKIEEHIFDNHWENDGIQPESCVIINPADNTNNFVIMNVIHETPAARIGATDYMSLAMAVEAAVDGDTVVILKDISVAKSVDISKALTIDMNGKTLSSEVPGIFNVYSDLTIVGEGTIEGPIGENAANFDGNAVINVEGEKAKLTLDKVSIIADGVGSDGMYGVYVLNGGTLVSNNPTIVSHFAAIGMNNTTAPATIQINGGSYIAKANPVNGDSVAWWSYFCAALYASATSNIDINGGHFEGYYAISSRYSTVNQNLTINNGEFIGTEKALFVDNVEVKNQSGIRVILVKGGTFSTDPSEYVPEGYKVTTTNGNYVVSEKTQQDYMNEIAVEIATTTVKNVFKGFKTVASVIKSYIPSFLGK